MPAIPFNGVLFKNSMKIQLLSDLHLEFEPFDYTACDSDVVVLAGDIHTKDRGVQWALDTITDKPVIYVLGNHEYYGKTYPKLVAEAQELARHSNVHVLENDVVRIGNVNFLGCTLWTDFELFGDPSVAGYHCQQRLTDYKKIKRLPNYSKIRSIDTAVAHKKSKHWLENELRKRTGETNVVVSHHGPSLHSVSAEHRDDMTTAAYVSHLDTFIQANAPTLWLHGHLHHSSDYRIGACRVMCNPKGYSGEDNPDFQPEVCIDIPSPQSR